MGSQAAVVDWRALGLSWIVDPCQVLDGNSRSSLREGKALASDVRAADLGVGLVR